MKKVLSILSVILILASMLHIYVAMHYCGGELAASKISLSGDPAGCGMERPGGSCPSDNTGDFLKSHCCDDVVINYSINNNYTQSQTSVSEATRLTKPFSGLPVSVPVQLSGPGIRVFAYISPPVFLMHSAVELTNICVFRI